MAANNQPACIILLETTALAAVLHLTDGYCCAAAAVCAIPLHCISRVCLLVASRADIRSVFLARLLYFLSVSAAAPLIPMRSVGSWTSTSRRDGAREDGVNGRTRTAASPHTPIPIHWRGGHTFRELARCCAAAAADSQY